MTPTERAAWLASLQVGDEVGLAMYKRPDALGIVSHRTPGGMLKVKHSDDRCESSFSKSGVELQGSVGRRELVPVTDKFRETIERERLQDSLKATPWHRLPTDTLRQVVEIVGRSKENGDG